MVPEREPDSATPLLHLSSGEELRSVAAPAATPGVRNRRGHLLVVDDNATNRLVAEAMLTRSGYTVDLAENGREAVEAVARTPYDAVLMDCEMPVLDGYAATQEIRAAEGEARHTRIVALTAAAMRGDADRALAAGMDAHVTKPITFDRLHEELDRLLAQHPEVPELDEVVLPDAGSSVDTEPLELLLRLDASGDLVRRIVQVFLREGSAQTDDLRAAVAAADLDGVGRACHGLCGMSCAVGAVVVTAQCRSLEGLARQGALPPLAAVEDLVRELGRASAALTAFLQGRVPART